MQLEQQQHDGLVYFGGLPKLEEDKLLILRNIIGAQIQKKPRNKVVCFTDKSSDADRLTAHLLNHIRLMFNKALLIRVHSMEAEMDVILRMDGAMNLDPIPNPPSNAELFTFYGVQGLNRGFSLPVLPKPSES